MCATCLVVCASDVTKLLSIRWVIDCQIVSGLFANVVVFELQIVLHLFRNSVDCCLILICACVRQNCVTCGSIVCQIRLFIIFGLVCHMFANSFVDALSVLLF